MSIAQETPAQETTTHQTHDPDYSCVIHINSIITHGSDINSIYSIEVAKKCILVVP